MSTETQKYTPPAGHRWVEIGETVENSDVWYCDGLFHAPSNNVVGKALVSGPCLDLKNIPYGYVRRVSTLRKPSVPVPAGYRLMGRGEQAVAKQDFILTDWETNPIWKPLAASTEVKEAFFARRIDAEEVSDMGRLTGDAAKRKQFPLCTGLLDYFPDALLAVAEVSKIGNDQHNPGQPIHWARGKSQDEGDAMMRHQLDRGKFDTDGARHSAKVAWRALAQLQKEIEQDLGLPISRGSRQ